MQLPSSREIMGKTKMKGVFHDSYCGGREHEAGILMVPLVYNLDYLRYDEF